MSDTIATRICLRRDTSANWTSNNPVLLAGELGIETNTRKIKIGDGSTAWNSLSYIYDSGNTTYTISVSGNNVVLTPSSGNAQTITVPYATNAGTASYATYLGSSGTGNNYSFSGLQSALAAKQDALPSVTGNYNKFLHTNATTGALEWLAAATTVSWGGITGTISSQTDLMNKFGEYLPLNGGEMNGDLDMGQSSIVWNQTELKADQDMDLEWERKKLAYQEQIKNAYVSLQINGTEKTKFYANDSTNRTFNVTAADLGLTAAMVFVGISTTDPRSPSGATVSEHTTWKKGDVVLHNTKEYVNTTGSNTSSTTPNPNWTELGDEGSHALKTTTITGTGALSGGGSLEANRTITHNAGNAASTSSGLYKFSTDAYSHINSVTAVVKSDITSLGIPGQDTTYSAGTGLALNGTTFSVGSIVWDCGGANQ